MLDPRYNPPYRLPKNPRDWIDPRRIEMQLNHQRTLEQARNNPNDPMNWRNPPPNEMRLNHLKTVKEANERVSSNSNKAFTPLGHCLSCLCKPCMCPQDPFYKKRQDDFSKDTKDPFYKKRQDYSSNCNNSCGCSSKALNHESAFFSFSETNPCFLLDYQSTFAADLKNVHFLLKNGSFSRTEFKNKLHSLDIFNNLDFKSIQDLNKTGITSIPLKKENYCLDFLQEIYSDSITEEEIFNNLLENHVKEWGINIDTLKEVAQGVKIVPDGSAGYQLALNNASGSLILPGISVPKNQLLIIISFYYCIVVPQDSIDDFVKGHFQIAEDITEKTETLIHELIHVFLYKTECYPNLTHSQNEYLTRELTKIIRWKAKVHKNKEAGDITAAAYYQSQLDTMIVATKRYAKDCLEKLGL